MIAVDLYWYRGDGSWMRESACIGLRRTDGGRDSFLVCHLLTRGQRGRERKTSQFRCVIHYDKSK